MVSNISAKESNNSKLKNNLCNMHVSQHNKQIPRTIRQNNKMIHDPAK